MNFLTQHLYRARYVMPMSAPVIENGAVVVANGTILAVGFYERLRHDYSEAFYHDLGEVILMPGLINAHCHLDYTMMRGALQPQEGFTSWIGQLNKIKFSLKEEDFLASIEEGCHELNAWGCTTVCNVASFPELLSKLPQGLLRLWHCIEVMDIRGPEQGEMGLANTENFFKKEKKDRMRFGLSPHAPLTVSQDLYRRSAALTCKYHVPFCTHLAESEEEWEMFTKGSGPLFDFLKNFKREMSDCGSKTPVQSLLQNDLLPRGALLVHMNYLGAEDYKLLSSRAADFFIVHCPKTHRFFGRPPFDWKFFYDHGYRLLLGTDSLASNDSLNLFQEMQLMAATAPELAPEEILKMVTLYPAQALGMKEKLGELSVGAFADMIAIPFEGALEAAVEAMLYNKDRPILVESK
ncbi:MAG: amidohydrolase family protein [Chthoniobacterales bacterium]|nr:amidohydrolase family protein [Chthoniobacterales bacterium]